MAPPREVSSHRISVETPEDREAGQEMPESSSRYQYHPPYAHSPPYPHMGPGYGFPPNYNSPVPYHPPPQAHPPPHQCCYHHALPQPPHISYAQASSPVRSPEGERVVVNVQNTNRQEQGQRQEASVRQLTVKEKVINNTARALDGLLDRKVLMTGLMALILPRVVAHLQASGEKKKKRGITLNLGFGSFA